MLLASIMQIAFSPFRIAYTFRAIFRIGVGGTRRVLPPGGLFFNHLDAM
jgi:hypothetical protein